MCCVVLLDGYVVVFFVFRIILVLIFLLVKSLMSIECGICLLMMVVVLMLFLIVLRYVCIFGIIFDLSVGSILMSVFEVRCDMSELWLG